MFHGFSDATADFLWGLMLNNDRGWFNANRETFEAVLDRPIRALAAETLSRFQALYPDEAYNLHVARIYRDARRLYGRGPFKENLWFTIQQGRREQGEPTFWFELDSRSWSYGMGCWEEDADHAAAWRAAIDADPERFNAIVDEICAGGPLTLWGDMYKRPKADRGEKLNPWYNRKNLSVGWTHGFGGALYSEALPDLLAADYRRLMPMYRFQMEIYERLRADRAALRAMSTSAHTPL